MSRSSTDGAAAAGVVTLTTAHRRRLRALWRSAGWPSHDALDLELLVAGLLSRHLDAAGRESLRLTDAGLHELARTVQGHRSARDAHEALVARVSLEMHRAGRLVWRGLSLRAPVAAEVAGPDGSTAAVTRWAMAMPDVFSIRPSTLEAHVEPVVHEIKVRRADLLGDLKKPAKGEAYRALASQCWYVLAAGIGDEHDVPEVYGVMRAHPVAGAEGLLRFGALEVLRPAPRRACRVPHAGWLALARATPERFDDEPQASLMPDEDVLAPGPGDAA
ncbi:hypothetical protein [Ideonella margarita]|uniref:PD-(D/E)XK nuclease superfamily protein n=1 Tax=Ideonella margarita TaxID=2984191 RepID=A0ABU9C4F3_9BURK